MPLSSSHPVELRRSGSKPPWTKKADTLGSATVGKRFWTTFRCDANLSSRLVPWKADRTVARPSVANDVLR